MLRLRVGTIKDNQPRITIAKFNSVDEKHKLYRGRDTLRNNNIRISEELTSRERDILKNLRENGRNGYFYKGKLRGAFEKSMHLPFIS